MTDIANPLCPNCGAALPAKLGGTAALLQAAATKKVQQRLETTRKAIAERDEAVLRECVEKLQQLYTLEVQFAKH
jgi:hypothetical protein